MNITLRKVLPYMFVLVLGASSLISCYKGNDINGGKGSIIDASQGASVAQGGSSIEGTGSADSKVKEISNKIISETITLDQLEELKKQLEALKASTTSAELIKQIEELLKQIDLMIANMKAKQSAEAAAALLIKEAGNLISAINGFKADMTSLEGIQLAIDTYNLYLASILVKKDAIEKLIAQLSSNSANADLVKTLKDLLAQLVLKENELKALLVTAENKKTEFLNSLPCADSGIQNFGSDFQAYLNKASNNDLTGFGGSNTKTGSCTIVHQPVIFIHGNADNADGSALPDAAHGGWKASRDFFLSKGYKPSELYAVNFGLAGLTASGSGSLNYHTPQNVSKIYRFIEAVRNYTGAAKVDIVAHSLGVTTVRRAVKGGNYCDLFTCANLGPSLNAYIDTFVGIAGANRGLNTCGVWPLNQWIATCGPHGFSIGNPFLAELNGGYSNYFGYQGTNWKVGAYTYSILSYVDELTCAPMMPTTCHIWTVHTSKFRNEDGSKTYYTYPYGHMGIKNLTAEVQYNMVVNHTY